MVASNRTTLRAFRLALKQLEAPLTTSKRANLQTVGQPLALDSNEFIHSLTQENSSHTVQKLRFFQRIQTGF
jgi:hypothetical protein